MYSGRWTVLAAAVLVIVVHHEITGTQGADIGVRSMPAHESAAMTKFKKSLSAEEQALVQRYNSKSRFIQALLDRSKGVDKRDQVLSETAIDKRNDGSALECCSCNPGSEGCFHPSDVKRSRIIRCCIPAPAAVKREEIETSEQEVLEAESPADQALLQKHQSKIHYLVEAAKHPTHSDAAEKREQVEEENVKTEHSELTESQKEALQALVQQLAKMKNLVAQAVQNHDDETQEDVEETISGGSDITKRFMNDVNLAKRYGVKLDDLLSYIKRRTVKSAKAVRN